MDDVLLLAVCGVMVASSLLLFVVAARGEPTEDAVVRMPRPSATRDGDRRAA